MSVHQKKDGRWFVKHSRTGNPHNLGKTCEYFGRGPEAEAAANLRNIEIGLGQNKAKFGVTLSDVSEKFLVAKMAGMERKSLNTAADHLDLHLLPFFGHSIVTNIDLSLVDSYIQKRKTEPWLHGKTVKHGVTNSTIKRELTTLNAILNWSVKRGIITHNPIASYQMPKEDDAVIPIPTEKELAALLQHAAPHLARAIQISIYTAIRPGGIELLSLRWEHVDFIDESLHVTSARKGGLKSRRVPIARPLLRLLNDWHEQDSALKRFPETIVNYNGKQVKALQTSWETAKRKAKIFRRLRLYDMRHLAASNMLERGADLKSVSELLGHASPSTTMRVYQHVNTKMKRKAIDLLG